MYLLQIYAPLALFRIVQHAVAPILAQLALLVLI